MTNMDLLRALGRIDPRLIAEAAPDAVRRKSTRRAWVKWGVVAACFALIITASMLLYPSVVEGISSDGYETIYFLGGITVNMNGIFGAFFIAPIFSVVCTFLMWLIDSGSVILPLWLIRDLCIPILHFCILKRCIKKSKIQKKSTIWLVIALLLVTVAADSFVLEYLILKGRLAIPHIIFRLIWAILCGLFILGHTLVERFYRNNIRCNIMVAVGSTIVLCINAFMTYLLAPTLATKYAIDGIELLLMPLSIIILSMYSHLLGRIMTRRFVFVKLTGWLLGIIASEFVTLWLLGTPRILPTEDKVTTIIWIVVSAFVFIWCLIGVLKAHLEAIKQTSAVKKKPRNHTWVKWGAVAACLCLVIGVGFRVAMGFVPNQATDIFREGILVEITNEGDLPAQYDGELLAFNLDFPLYELYYRQDGAVENTEDWYSLLGYKYDAEAESRINLHCMFGDTTVEDWKVSSVFTKKATEIRTINGIEVQIARMEFSLNYEYWHYAIFEYDDVVYDIRIQSNHPAYVYEVLETLTRTK